MYARCGPCWLTIASSERTMRAQSPPDHRTAGEHTTDCSGDHAVMANRLDRGRPNPTCPQHLQCEEANGSRSANPIRDSGMSRTKSPDVRVQSIHQAIMNRSLGKRGRPCTDVTG